METIGSDDADAFSVMLEVGSRVGRPGQPPAGCDVAVIRAAAVLFSAVAHDAAFQHVDHILGDVGGVVGDPFQVPGCGKIAL